MTEKAIESNVTRRQFEQFIREQSPNAELTRAREGGYTDEGVHAAWIGFKGLALMQAAEAPL